MKSLKSKNIDHLFLYLWLPAAKFGIVWENLATRKQTLNFDQFGRKKNPDYKMPPTVAAFAHDMTVTRGREKKTRDQRLTDY
jgi:hypothetical protein